MPTFPKPSAAPPAGFSDPSDRRHEDRLHVDGEVLIAQKGSPAMIHGQLLDISASGFRAAHATSLLETGMVVHFRHAWATGEAKVVWNRNAEGAWESGFVIMTRF